MRYSMRTSCFFLTWNYILYFMKLNFNVKDHVNYRKTNSRRRKKKDYLPQIRFNLATRYFCFFFLLIIQLWYNGKMFKLLADFQNVVKNGNTPHVLWHPYWLKLISTLIFWRKISFLKIFSIFEIGFHTPYRGRTNISLDLFFFSGECAFQFYRSQFWTTRFL